MKRSLIISLGLVVLIATIIFYPLISQMNTALIDWRDYPYYTWIIHQNLEHLKTFQFDGFFNTNAFFPHQGSLLFSDLLLPQTLLALPAALVIQNPITVFNIAFIATIILNALSAWFLWRQLFKKSTALIFATVVTTFAPFFVLQISHFQMVSYWPLLIALGISFKKSQTWKTGFLVGGLAAIQFLASIYLAVFLLIILAVWYGLRLWRQPKKRHHTITQALSAASAFLVLAGPFYLKYHQVRQAYNITRDYGEYVTYAAHLSDYLFTNPYQSPLANIPPMRWLNQLNQHSQGELAALPSFTLLILAILALKRKSIWKDSVSQLFLITGIIGFLFSLGPRLSFNGQYISTLLPYAIVVKAVPLIAPVRALARWSFLFYLALIYLATKGISQLKPKHQATVAGAALIVYSLEVIPFNHPIQPKQYLSPLHNTIKNQCKPENVLLEYPFHQQTPEASVVTDLEYRATMLLYSLHHDCQLVNGYSGFIPQSQLTFEKDIKQAVQREDREQFFNLLQHNQVDLIKLNRIQLQQGSEQTINQWLSNSAIASQSGQILYQLPNSQL